MKTTKSILSLKRICLLLTAIFLCSVQTLWAVDPSTQTNLVSYYSAANGKTGETLRTALNGIINSHTVVSYDNLRYLYEYSDTYDAAGTTIEDIYSTCDAAYTTTFCSGACGGYNREHSVPKSWFGEGTPMYSDAFHLYATNCYVNSYRGNEAFGVCANGSPCTTSGVAGKALGRKGSSTFVADNGNSYTSIGTVFEPDDEYKGDLARTYFYMVTCYRTTNFTQAAGGAKMFTYSSGIAQLSQYSIDLLLKWHREDPVSKKELIRNEVIFGNTTFNKGSYKQGNRNPFIDFPCLAEYIWGEHNTENVDFSQLISGYTTIGTDGCPCGTDPAIRQPAGTINCGSTEANTPITKSVTILGVNLTANLSLAVSGTNASLFTLSTSTMTQANALEGTAITITYSPTAAGDHTAKLVISGGGLTSNYEVDITGSCCTTYDVTLSRNGVAEIISVCGTYTLPTASTEADACDGWAFKGWITSSTYNSETVPTYVTEVNSTQTLYAVYGKSIGSGSGSSDEFELFSGSLTEGDYIITSGTNALTNSVSNNRLTATTVTVTNNTITTTDAAIIWHIAQSGSYWTIYNADASKYAAGITDTKNTAQLLDSGTDDHSLWTASGTYEFENKARAASSSNSGNKYLRFNSGYGFGCYATGTGSSLTLYKMSGSGGTMTYMTDPCTIYSITYAHGGGVAAHGTYTANPTTAAAGTIISLDAEPEECYLLTNWAVTEVGGSGSVTVTNDQFTMPAYNVLLTPTFTAQPDRTATFMNGTATFATETGCVGKVISVGTPTACEGYTFVGWSTQTYALDNTTTPTIDFDGTIPSANTTYHAVFTKTEAGSGTVLTNNYAKITSTDDLTDGNYVIVYNNNGIYKAMSTEWKDTYYLAPVEVSATNDIITTTDASIIWQISKSNDQITIYNASSHYLYIETSTSSGKTYYNIKLGDNTTDNKFTYEYSDGWVLTTVTESRFLQYHIDRDRWSYYTSGIVDLYKQQSAQASTTYYTTSSDCGCTVTITANPNSEDYGSTSVTDTTP